jgi:surface antigen
MQRFGTGKKAILLGSALLLGCTPAFASPREKVGGGQQSAELLIAATYRPAAHAPSGYHSHAGAAGTAATHWRVTQVKGRRSVHPGGISCVPYARMVSGIEVGGNAWQWWDNAAGTYARGDRPEIGAILNFRSNGRMPLGHVAVVRKVVNAREVIIDHANWPSGGGRGAVSRNISVVDVSEANNWSAVRVELGRSGSFGSVYPTYGFIYDRPDHGTIEVSAHVPAPQPDLNPVPSDLRPVAERPWNTYEEVAEAPVRPHRQAGRGLVRSASMDAAPRR